VNRAKGSKGQSGNESHLGGGTEGGGEGCFRKERKIRRLRGGVILGGGVNQGSINIGQERKQGEKVYRNWGPTNPKSWRSDQKRANVQGNCVRHGQRPIKKTGL